MAALESALNDVRERCDPATSTRTSAAPLLPHVVASSQMPGAVWLARAAVFCAVVLSTCFVMPRDKQLPTAQTAVRKGVRRGSSLAEPQISSATEFAQDTSISDWVAGQEILWDKYLGACVKPLG